MYTDSELMSMMAGKMGVKNLQFNSANHDTNLMNWAVAEPSTFGSREGSNHWAMLNGTMAGANYSGYIEPIKGNKNKVFIVMPDGSMQLFRAVNIVCGVKGNQYNTGRLWQPVGAPTMPSPNGRNLNPYRQETSAMNEIDENKAYSKAAGS
jgi:hypothetical protein